MLTDSQLQAIAFVIRLQYGGNFAFCVDVNNPAKIYIVLDIGFQAGTPDSCLVRLVQEMVPICMPNWKGNSGIYFCKTGPINQMEQGMLDFAYPKCNVRSDVAPLPLIHSVRELVLCNGNFVPTLQCPYANLLFNHSANYPIRDNDLQIGKVHRIYMMAAYALLNSPKIPKSYSVAAILVDPDGRIISYGINQSYKNSTCHAEVNALQGCLRNGIAIPAQSILYTTLEPCCMCAGMINVCMQNGVVVYNVRDTHFNGTSSHMGYHSAIPMHQLGVSAKKLTTWKTGRAYNKIDKDSDVIDQERLHDDLGTSINEDHQSIERSSGKRTGIITYLNKDDQKFIPEGSHALTRKKEKYWFRGRQVELNPFVQQALGEAVAFLDSLKISVVTVQEEYVKQIVEDLARQFFTEDERLWPIVYGCLLATIGDSAAFDRALFEIEHTPDEFFAGLLDRQYKNSLIEYRGRLLYS